MRLKPAISTIEPAYNDKDAIDMALATQSDGAVESAVPGAVSAQRMMAGLKTLAQWSKVATTPGEASSFAWLKQQLDEIGLKTRLISHDAYISIPGPARLVIGERTVPAITHAMSLSSPQGGLTGLLVDLGDGSRKAFAGREVAGRIVLVDGIASPAVAALASAAGAIGVVQISPHHLLHEMCISPIWGSPSTQTRAALPQVVAVTVSNDDGRALREGLSAGASEVTLYAEVDTGWRKTPLLVGDMPSSGKPEEPFILLSCHVDTWFQGVMDNGSANIAMLEVVRLCMEARRDWKRGLRICFWSGHSQGRYSGSAWYADNHWTELDARCAAHVNLDSPGGIGGQDLTRTGSAGGLYDIAAAAIAAETGQKLAGRRKARSADDSFPGVGIPSVFGSLSLQEPGEVKMRNDLGWWWHTEHDLIDKIDPDFLVRDTRVVLRVVLNLLTQSRLPLDYSAQISKLAQELEDLSGRLGGRFDLGETLEAAGSLADALVRLRRGELDPATHDQVLMRLSRVLVPLDYTAGDRFVHDPALALSPWPVLDAIRRLASAPEGDEGRFAAVDAVRARNRLSHALREALSVVRGST
jgi:hypothetical protein